jgi:hypothetical protein
MTLKNILLTMHDDELGYEIFANIFEEINFAAIFQASQRTCLSGFMFCLLNNITRNNDKQKIAYSFLFWGLSPKVLLCKTLVER